MNKLLYSIKIASVGFLAILAWYFVVRELLGLLQITLHTSSSSEPPFYVMFLRGCVIAPLWEELAFRYAPIKIAHALNISGDRYSNPLLLPIIIISSVIFGFGHGGGISSLMIQGVMGVIMSWVFVKGGYKEAVLTHAGWNLFCTIMNIQISVI